ncbi:MAG: ribosome maturation factor RimP [Paenibacillus sp. RIFOXYA1_FULL_44_5]|nr:MAG: ribosome maturation factor RimP [Paenibacillus sp. RIFOXYA1_FULL_44_5]
MSTRIKAITEKLLQPILIEEAVELVDIEYVKEGSNWFLRIYIDKEGGVDIEDCGRVNEQLSKKLDETDPISNAYFLEVSSPGAERPLKKPQDVEKAVNKQVFITTYETIDGLKQFEGKLLSFDGEQLVIQLSKKQHVIPYDKVASARLAIIF